MYLLATQSHFSIPCLPLRCCVASCFNLYCTSNHTNKQCWRSQRKAFNSSPSTQVFIMDFDFFTSELAARLLLSPTSQQGPPSTSKTIHLSSNIIYLSLALSLRNTNLYFRDEFCDRQTKKSLPTENSTMAKHRWIRHAEHWQQRRASFHINILSSIRIRNSGNQDGLSSNLRAPPDIVPLRLG